MWSPQHFLLRDGVQKIFHLSLDMDFTSIIHERWSAKKLLMRNGENVINLLEMEYTEFNNEKWTTRYLLIIYEAHDIYSREMKSTLINEKWGTQHLLWKDAIHCFY